MKEKIVSILFVFMLLVFSLGSIIAKDNDISYKERRTLTKMPSLNLKSIFSGSDNYFENLTNYFNDQFIFRDNFKSLKGITTSKIFLMKENNGIYEKDNYLFQMETNVNKKSIDNLLNKIKYIDNTYLDNQNKYFVMIPDKNYYLDDENIPKLGYNNIIDSLKNRLPNDVKWIDITKSLTLDSYYKTDIHFKESKLSDVVKTLSNNMNFESSNTNYTLKKYYPFYGALYGKVASNIKADEIEYLTNDVINNASVYNYEKNRVEKVYMEDYLKNVDSYDVFLSGATPLLIIENKFNDSGKELVMFRDSFASSLAPLLIESYSKIVMIDLRYVSSKYLEKINEFSVKEDADVMFIYSAVIINNSFSLK